MIIMKFEMLQKLPKCGTQTCSKANGFGKTGTNRVSQHRVVTNLQSIKKTQYLKSTVRQSAIKRGVLSQPGFPARISVENGDQQCW